VLFLYSYGPNFAPFRELAAGIRRELQRSSSTPVEFFEASLETMRFPETNVGAPLAAYLSALFQESEIDLVISVGGPAARFCLDQRERLFPSTPLLLAGLERRLLDDATGTPSVTVAGDLPGKIEHILRVLPETNHIVVVSTGSVLGKFWVGQARQEFQPFTDRVDFTFLGSSAESVG
jgi:hypothetical protein